VERVRDEDRDLIDGKPFTVTPWVKPLSVYIRHETHEGGGARFG
jgi:hypothetical protein